MGDELDAPDPGDPPTTAQALPPPDHERTAAPAGVPTDRTHPEVDATPSELRAGPSVFLSYRQDDSSALAARLAGELRRDLGGAQVFRDRDDLIGGQPWREALMTAITSADVATVVIGPEWLGVRPDGTRRIDDDHDVVRAEVEAALAVPSCTPVPALVDGTDLPALPASISALGDLHAVRLSSGTDTDGPVEGYQGLLVSTWYAISKQYERGVIIVGDGSAMARLDALVDELKAAKRIDASELSRFACGAYVVSGRATRRAKRRWPDAIVLIDDESPSQIVLDRLAALVEHPKIRDVALVGAGAAAVLASTTAAGLVGSGGSSSGASVASFGSVTAATPSTGGAVASASAAWGAAGIGAKVAVVGGAVVAAGAATGVVVTVVSDDASSVAYAARTELAPTGDDVELQYPLDDPSDVVVRLGDERPSDTGAFGPDESEAIRSVTLEIPELGETFDLGDVILPTSLSSDFATRQGDRDVALERVSTTARLDAGDLAIPDYCYNTGDPSTAIGGWVFTPGEMDFTVSFVATFADGDVTDTRIVVSASGASALELLPGAELGDGTDRCTPVTTSEVVWSS